MNSRFLAACLRIERELWSNISFLDRDDRETRMPGYASLFLVPDGGIPGVIDAEKREILIEALSAADQELDSAKDMAAEIVLAGTPDEIETSRRLLDALWDICGAVETFADFDAAADSAEHARHLRDEFARAARSGIRSEGTLEAMDSRPA